MDPVYVCVKVPVPCVPRGQEHLYVFMRSMQVPPFWQGWDRHSFISLLQLTPWYPGTHWKRETDVRLILMVYMCDCSGVCVFSYLAAVSSQVIGAGGSILAGVRHALIHLLLTVAARVSGLTSTQVCVTSINTLTRITTQNDHWHSWERETASLWRATFNVVNKAFRTVICSLFEC